MCFCTVDRPVGRSTHLFGLLAAAGAVIFGLTRLGGVHSSPAWVTNDSATAPDVRVISGVRHVVSASAQATLLPDTSSPIEPVRLLWLNGRSTQPTKNGSIVLDADGGILDVDQRLRLRLRKVSLGGREVVSAAAAPGRRLWVTTLTGEVLIVNTAGEVERTMETGAFTYAGISSSPSGENAWLVRSTARYEYHLDSAAPLLVRMTNQRDPIGVGRALIPEHSLLIDLANAGHVAAGEGVVYYAPFIRDEIIALRDNGDTMWVASRALPQSTTNPRFEIEDGRAVVNYHPVNLGIAVGPDGNVYVLSTPRFTTTLSRLDVLDPESGVLLRSVELSTALPTIAISKRGRAYLLDGERLVENAPHRATERLAVISLPLLGGAHATVHDSARVTLVNVWASWCEPCRTEMPALDSLRRELAGDDRFRFVTVNEDVGAGDAQRFMTELGFSFPVLLGEGRMRDRLHYPGLPYTVLVDAENRVVGKWIGYTGPSQLMDIRRRIESVLGLNPAPASHVHH
jgi:thiol-disulfide isomerase/thioredoxin